MPFQLNMSGHLLPLASPVVMGILNVTTDSFYDGGKYTTEEAVLARAAAIKEEGAAIIDVGAVSTRPGAADVPEEQERTLIGKTVALLHQHFPEVPLSVDTWRASVAEEAVRQGASMINDISGGTFDERMIPVVGALQVPYCLMHTTAKPEVMQQQTEYTDLIADVLQFFGRQLEKLHQHHVHDIVLDPGFGFGKTLEQNYQLLKNLSAFQELGYPLLAGVSRKSMIYKLLNATPDGALNGTTAVHMLALLQGALILRVHDVREAVETIRIFETYQHV
jgi:dihydropteroate synthase